MTTMYKFGSALCALSLLFASSCASIIKGSYQHVQIQSQPDEATLKVYDRKGDLITSGKTPQMLTLKKGTGYFKGARYRLVLEKEGFQTSEVKLENRVTAWYWGGNLIFGGLIGYLIVDPLTGAMWRLSPEEVHAQLGPQAAALLPQGEGLIVMMRAQVPESLVPALEPLGNAFN